MRPQAHTQAQVEDRVLQRRTTLKNEEPHREESASSSPTQQRQCRSLEVGFLAEI